MPSLQSIRSAIVSMRSCPRGKLAWKRRPSCFYRSVNIRRIFLAATAGETKVVGYRVFAARAQWLAA